MPNGTQGSSEDPNPTIFPAKEVIGVTNLSLFREPFVGEFPRVTRRCTSRQGDRARRLTLHQVDRLCNEKAAIMQGCTTVRL